MDTTIMDRADLEQWKGREVARLLALVETERRYYQEIVASFPIGAVVVSSTGAIVFANRAFRRLAALRPGEVLQKAVDGVLSSPQLSAAVEESLQLSTAVSNIPVQLSGSTYQASVIPLDGWEDNPEREALIAFENGGAAPLPAPSAEFADWPALLWTIDPDTRQFLSLDGAQEHLLGYTREHWLSTPDFWQERIHPDDRRSVADFYQSAIGQGGEFACEFRAITASHKTLWSRDSFRVTLDDAGRAVRINGITTNVSGHRRAEQENIQANRIDALVDLARRLSHEFNNSLMVVTGYGEELLSNLDETDSRRADVQSILAAAEIMAGVSGELHGFTRKQASAAVPTGLNDILATVAARIREELGATLVLRLPPQPISALADATQLEAMLMSVARRLRDKADPHMIIVAGVVPVDEMSNLALALAPGRYVEISLRGPRAAQVSPSAFESLIAGKDPHGVDMARSFAIVREWGGSMFIERTEHTTEVHVLLPAFDTASAIETRSPEVPQLAPEPEPTPLPAAVAVMVVEDERGIRGLIQKVLSREGYEVVEASDADDAMEAARQSPSPIRLLIADLKLSGKSGRELAEAMLAKDPGLRVLYISGYTDEPEAVAEQLGPNADFLQKPFTLATLRKKVREMIDPGQPSDKAAGAASA